MNLKQLRDNINAICERIERHPHDNLEDYTVGIPTAHQFSKHNNNVNDWRR